MQGPGEGGPDPSSVLPSAPQELVLTLDLGGILGVHEELREMAALHLLLTFLVFAECDTAGDAEATSCSPHILTHTTYSHMCTHVCTSSHHAHVSAHTHITHRCICHMQAHTLHMLTYSYPCDHTHKVCARVCLCDFKEKVQTWALTAVSCLLSQTLPV